MFAVPAIQHFAVMNCGKASPNAQQTCALCFFFCCCHQPYTQLGTTEHGGKGKERGARGGNGGGGRPAPSSSSASAATITLDGSTRWLRECMEDFVLESFLPQVSC